MLDLSLFHHLPKGRKMKRYNAQCRLIKARCLVSPGIQYCTRIRTKLPIINKPMIYILFPQLTTRWNFGGQMMEISSNNLDHLTRALFAHLRSGEVRTLLYIQAMQFTIHLYPFQFLILFK